MCFTPYFFPKMNSYACACVQWVYIPYTDLIVHFVGVLEIFILFERLKIMNEYVHDRFKIGPRNMCVIAFVICFLLDAFYATNYVPVNGGEFFLKDKQQNQTQTNTFYYLDTSPLAQTPIGSSILICIYVIRNIFTLVTTVIMSLVTHFQMKDYFLKRNIRFSIDCQDTRRDQIDQITATSLAKITIISTPSQQLSDRVNKNHLKLITTLCVITVTSRTVSLLCDLYFLFRFDEVAFVLASLLDLIYVLGPTISFFVFYNFNSNFRAEFSLLLTRIDEKFSDVYVN